MKQYKGNSSTRVGMNFDKAGLSPCSL